MRNTIVSSITAIFREMGFYQIFKEVYRHKSARNLFFKRFLVLFMSKVFDGRKAETALLLRIILGDPGIKVISVAMCAIVEDYANEVAERREKEAVQRANRKAILKGFQGGLTKEMAMTMYPKYTPNDIEELYKKAQKSLLNRKAAK